MMNKLLEYLRHLMLHKEQTERNTSDIKIVKQDVDDMTSVMQRFGLELTHLERIEEQEREKLALRLENILLRERSLQPGITKAETNLESVLHLFEELKRENELLRIRIDMLEQNNKA